MLPKLYAAYSDDTGSGGDCTAGSGADTIKVPAGHYSLTGAANDDQNLSGDLDIDSDVTIAGAGELAVAAGADLEAVRFNRVITSGLPRAVETARLLLQRTGQAADIEIQAPGSHTRTARVKLLRPPTKNGNDSSRSRCFAHASAGQSECRTAGMTPAGGNSPFCGPFVYIMNAFSFT